MSKFPFKARMVAVQKMDSGITIVGLLRALFTAGFTLLTRNDVREHLQEFGMQRGGKFYHRDVGTHASRSHPND